MVMIMMMMTPDILLLACNNNSLHDDLLPVKGAGLSLPVCKTPSRVVVRLLHAAAYFRLVA